MFDAVRNIALVVATGAYLYCISSPAGDYCPDSTPSKSVNFSKSSRSKEKPLEKSIPLRTPSRISKATSQYAFSPLLPEKNCSQLHLESGTHVYAFDSECKYLLQTYSSLSDRSPPVVS